MAPDPTVATSGGEDDRKDWMEHTSYYPSFGGGFRLIEPHTRPGVPPKSKRAGGNNATQSHGTMVFLSDAPPEKGSQNEYTPSQTPRQRNDTSLRGSHQQQKKGGGSHPPVSRLATNAWPKPPDPLAEVVTPRKRYVDAMGKGKRVPLRGLVATGRAHGRFDREAQVAARRRCLVSLANSGLINRKEIEGLSPYLPQMPPKMVTVSKEEEHAADEGSSVDLRDALREVVPSPGHSREHGGLGSQYTFFMQQRANSMSEQQRRSSAFKPQKFVPVTQTMTTHDVPRVKGKQSVDVAGRRTTVTDDAEECAASTARPHALGRDLTLKELLDFNLNLDLQANPNKRQQQGQGGNRSIPSGSVTVR